jgi:hypothetical protein
VDELTAVSVGAHSAQALGFRFSIDRGSIEKRTRVVILPDLGHFMLIGNGIITARASFFICEMCGGVMKHYQVVSGWGPNALATVAHSADVIIWVNALNLPAHEPQLADFPPSASVIECDLQASFAAAQWAYEKQLQVGSRLLIAVLCADSAGVSVPDFLGAGAVIERLAQLGLDALSPEAAVLNASYLKLSPAMNQLISASLAVRGSGNSEDNWAINEHADSSSITVLRD